LIARARQNLLFYRLTKKTVADTRKRVICASNALGTIFAHGCA